MKVQYLEKRFGTEAKLLILKMNLIVAEYLAQNFRLTVRQLYYQLVARDIVPNTEKSYKRITGIVNDAKISGLMDWDAIEDRTRSFISRSRWSSRADILRLAAEQYHMDMWLTQRERVFVIVEKEALAGVLEPTCHAYDVPLLAARGYPSGTVLHEFVYRDLLPAIQNGQEITILHLGDHDPSGIDMSRDLTDRIRLFLGHDLNEWWELKRIALNRAQITKYNPPPNPAKATDARFSAYQRKHGGSSWELDALEPRVLADLVESELKKVINVGLWQSRRADIEESRARLRAVADAEGSVA